MTQAIRVDPVSGLSSIHPDFSSKPAPRSDRDLPEITGACAFCAMAGDISAGSPSLTDGQEPRQLVGRRCSTFAIPNRWPIFPPDLGAVEVIIPVAHVSTFDDLAPDQALDFLSLIKERFQVNKALFTTTIASVSVGKSVGSSQPHLHSQVVGSPLEPTPLLASTRVGGSWDEDIQLAKNVGRITGQFADLTSWVPYAPSYPTEIRILGGSDADHAKEITRLLKNLASNGMLYSYNLSFHFGTPSFSQIILRIDKGLMYPNQLGVVVAAALDQVASGAANPKLD